MTSVLDADTHVAEPPEMWSYLDPEWYPRRPVVVEVPEDTLYGTSDRMWLIDGQIFPKVAGRGGNLLVTPSAQSRFRDRGDVKARELLDLALRYEDMATMGVDAQVVYPTLFFAYLTHDAAYEVALAKAYNRFMADVWAKSEGRIQWVVVPPLRDVDSTIKELQFGRENGACGIFFRGIEGDRTLDDPYFFPVYEEAESLYQRSLTIREKALGPEHPSVANSLENYAALLRKTKRNAEADRLEKRAKAIRAKSH